MVSVQRFPLLKMAGRASGTAFDNRFELFVWIKIEIEYFEAGFLPRLLFVNNPVS